MGGGRGGSHVALEEEGEEGGNVFALYRGLCEAGAAEGYSERVQHGGAGEEYKGFGVLLECVGEGTCAWSACRCT